MRIRELQIKSGYFWLPSKPENKVPGTIRISDGGEIELDIIGTFDDEMPSLNVHDLPRIVGHIEQDGFVTLDRCFYTKKKISFGGISKSLLNVGMVLTGARYAENEEITFSTFRFAVEGLDEWLNKSGLKVDYDIHNKAATIKYQSPSEESFMLSNGLKMSFVFNWTIPGHPIFTEAKITQTAYIKLQSDTVIPLSEFISTTYKLTTLLCFAIDQTVSIRDVSATSPELQQEIAKDDYRPVNIKLFYSSLPFSKTTPKIEWHSMLFRYPDIRDNAVNIFNNWLNAYDVIEPSFNLYFSSKTGGHKYLESKLLSLAQGLETYHRRKSKETRMAESQYKELVSILLEACPSDKQEWLSAWLKYGNEINLGARLKKVMEPFKDRIGNNDDRKKLIRSIVNTRNYFTHYDDAIDIDPTNIQALWNLCMKMEAIFQLHFLKEVGFTDDQINNVVKHNNELKNKLKKI